MMKQVCCILVLLTLIATVSPTPLGATDELPVLLIDVRSPEEYNAGHLPGAINIERSVIRYRIRKYARRLDQRIGLYCDNGQRSRIATNILRNMGYRNARDLGRYDDLRAQSRSSEAY